ncbi:MAG: hypothetical protein B7Z36_05945 [Novosphingobium sp. 12-63-9]|nr:MAG: hypothetical protein B7Z36_05945 [Novosphingobium sp. 12-63-9]
MYERRTGAIEDNLPVFQISQDSARYAGVEIEASKRLVQVGQYVINIDGVADYIRATIKNVGPAPRIPPLRLLAGLEAQADRLQGRLEVERVFGQNRTAVGETATAGYTMINASAVFKPFRTMSNTTITLSANNILDVDARRHASFLKDFAPLAGRDIRVTGRVTF